MEQKARESAHIPIRVGVSACLLGRKVRYDGGHRHEAYLTDTLGRHFDFVPLCPEVEIGVGVPRPILQLVRHDDGVRLVMPDVFRNLTRKMRAWAKARAAELVREDLSGCVLKRNSPSCGLRAPAVTPGGRPARSAPGLFAEALLKRFPHLPVIEEHALHNPPLRESWIDRVFAYDRLQRLWAAGWDVGDLVRFHTAHKYLLLTHSPKAYQDLGRLVAAADSIPRKELRRRYEAEFMAALAIPATPRKNVNVLHHMLGLFKRDLDAASRQELLDRIEDYRRGTVPLVVPMTLISQHAGLLDVPYLASQVYLNPHPKELAIRNDIGWGWAADPGRIMMTWRSLLIGSLAVAVILVLIWIFRVPFWRESDAVFSVLCTSLALSLGSLLGIWVALGGRPTPWRFVAAAAAGVGWTWLSRFRWVRMAIPYGVARLTSILLTQAMITCVPFCLLRLVGVGLVRVSPGDSARDQAPEARRLQFSLRQLLEWTTALAVSLSLLHYLHLPKDFFSDLLRLRVWIEPVMAALVAMAAFWTALGTRWLALRVAVLGLVVAVAGSASLSLYWYPDSWRFCYLIGFFALQALWVIEVLRLFRSAGYRIHVSWKRPRNREEER